MYHRLKYADASLVIILLVIVGFLVMLSSGCEKTITTGPSISITGDGNEVTYQDQDVEQDTGGDGTIDAETDDSYTEDNDEVVNDNAP